MVMTGDVMHMRADAVTGELPGGKRWLKIDVAEAAKSAGVDINQLTQWDDPSTLLDLLRAGGDDKELGDERIHGVQTTRYRADVDLAKAVESLPSDQRKAARASIESMTRLLAVNTIPVDVWIGDDKLLRRMEMAVNINTAAAGGPSDESLGLTVSTELYDYGTKVEVKAPPAAQTLDIAAMADSAGLTP